MRNDIEFVMRPERYACPSAAQLHGEVERARLSVWLARRGGWICEAFQADRFHQRLLSYLGTAKRREGA